MKDIFIEKPPVTSSNWYETMKNASILVKLGTNVNWTIASVTACSILNFLLPWQRGTSQNCLKSLFCIAFFPSKLISKCCNFSMDWDRVICSISCLDALWCFASMFFLLNHDNYLPRNMQRTFWKVKSMKVCVLAYQHMDFFISYHD
jgi:hypothetical protein